MNKVLILGYDIQNQSSQRIKKFVKYLPNYNWDPIVLNSWDPVSKYFVRKQRSIFHNEYRVVEIPFWVFPALAYKLGINRHYNLFLPDDRIGSIFPAFYKGLKIIKKENIKLIFVSCPPNSLAITGYLLKKVTQLPLILDFRDSWGFNPYVEYLRGLKKIDLFLCKRVLKTCNYIIAAFDSILNDYVLNFSWTIEKIKKITNGFDKSDFTQTYRPFKKFTITFAGSIYEGHSFRSPKVFLKALNNVLKTGKIQKGDIKILFIGSKCESLTKQIDEFNFNNIVFQTNRIPYDRALKVILKSHMLLLIEFSNSLPGKIYEYLASGKPILAMITKGEVEQLIQKYSSDNSYIFTDEEVYTQNIENALTSEYNKWKSGTLTLMSASNSKKYWEKYNRERLTQNLSKIFKEQCT